MSIMSAIQSSIRIFRTWAKINEPTIKLVGGIAAGAGCVVTACVATTHLDEVIDDHNHEMDILNVTKDHPESVVPEYRDQYTPDKYVANKTAIYIRTGLKIAKAYAVPAALGALSVALLVSGHGELVARNAALSSTLASVTASFDHYRDNVRKVYGAEVDDKLCQVLDEHTIEALDSNGNPTGKTKTVYSPSGTYYNDIYMFDFSPETTPCWTNDASLNLAYLKAQQEYAQRKLNAQGYLFLSDVLHGLGLKETKPARCCGWLYGDTVDFGFEDDLAFMDPKDPSCEAMLNFNVRGSILDKFEAEENR